MPAILPSFARRQAPALDCIDLQEAVVSRLDAVTATQVLTLGKKFAQPHVLWSILERNKRALGIDDHVLSALTRPAPVNPKLERESLEQYVFGHGLPRYMLRMLTSPLSFPGHFAVEAVKAGARRQVHSRLPKMPSFAWRHQLRGIYRSVRDGLTTPGAQGAHHAESIQNARRLVGEQGRRLAIVQRAFTVAVRHGWDQRAVLALSTGCVETSTLAACSPHALRRLAAALTAKQRPTKEQMSAMAGLSSARVPALQSLHEALATGACRGLDGLLLVEVEWLLKKPAMNALVAARPQALLALLPQLNAESALFSPHVVTALAALWQRASARREEAVLQALAPKAELLGGDASASTPID